jgi:hypothetical protein
MKTLCTLLLLTCSEFLQAQSWSQVGLGADQSAYCFLEDTTNHLWYVGGSFTTLDGQSINRIAVSSNGYTFTQVGSGFDGPVYTLAFYNGELYAGGNFTMSGVTTVNHIAKWNGVTWQSLGGGAQSSVLSLEVYQGELYTGGQFGTVSGMLNTKGIAKWNGSTWSSVGGGTSGFQTDVYTLKVYNNELYAGGTFYSIGGVSSQGVARWNGIVWSSVSGVGTSGGVPYTSITYSNRWFVGGNISTIDGVITYDIASWDGSNWFSEGDVSIPPVRCFSVHNNTLYVGGAFTAISVSSEKVAYFNGVTWSQVGAGFDADVNALGSFNGHLYAGGNFHFSGATPIEHFAIWDDTSLPVELCSFTCAHTDSIVSLRWVTLSEINSGHFVVSISLDGISYTDMFSVPAVGNTTTTHTYSFDDHSPPPGTVYYKLTEFDFGGRVAGVWNCVSIVPPQIRMVYRSDTDLLECGGCDDCVTVYNMMGSVVFKGYLPVVLGALPNGSYCARSIIKDEAYFFIVSK